MPCAESAIRPGDTQTHTYLTGDMLRPTHISRVICSNNARKRLAARSPAKIDLIMSHSHGSAVPKVVASGARRHCRSSLGYNARLCSKRHFTICRARQMARQTVHTKDQSRGTLRPTAHGRRSSERSTLPIACAHRKAYIGCDSTVRVTAMSLPAGNGGQLVCEREAAIPRSAKAKPISQNAWGGSPH